MHDEHRLFTAQSMPGAPPAKSAHPPHLDDQRVIASLYLMLEDGARAAIMLPQIGKVPPKPCLRSDACTSRDGIVKPCRL